MNVRAKFQCNSVTLAPSGSKAATAMRHDAGGGWAQVMRLLRPATARRMRHDAGGGQPQVMSKTWKFSAVTSGSEETGGNLEIYCVNPEVEFELGKEYYLDISLAAQ